MIRNIQKYRGCGCEAYFRLNLQTRGTDKGLYKITAANFNHNHEITKEAFMFHHRNRQLPENLRESATEMLATGSKPAKIALLMSEKSNKVVLAKDLYNYNRRTNKQSDTEDLKTVIDRQIQRDGANNFHYIESDSKEKLYGIFYQSNRMRRLFKTYGTLMFLDGTYQTNRNSYPCLIFVVTDHNRESRIVGFVLIAHERLVVMKAVMGFFKQLNDTSILKNVMIDKDLKEDSAISEAFPGVNVLYCFFHVENVFKKHFRGETFTCVKEMMLAESEVKFNQKLNDFNNLGKFFDLFF